MSSLALVVSLVTSHPPMDSPAFASRRSLVVGGQATQAHEFPFVLSFTHHGTHTCGASLISPLWALTAAHCVDPRLPPSAYAVEVHRHDLSLPSTHDHACAESATIQETHCHPGYVKATRENDICLLKLSQAPRCASGMVLPHIDTGDASTPGTLATVAGWGALSDSEWTRPAKLHSARLPIISNLACSAYLGSTTVSGSMLCALSSGRDACQGDSGGPLFVEASLPTAQPVQIGVVSWAHGCGEALAPGVYTRLSYYRSWIGLLVEPHPPSPPTSPIPPLPPPSPSSPPVVPTFATACECAPDGVSGGFHTGRPGCADHLNDDMPFCYVISPLECAFSYTSYAYPGAGWRFCAPSAPGNSASSGAPPTSPTPLGIEAGLLCSNRCFYSIYISDGECDDGGPGATFNLCTLGRDCADCGVRHTTDAATAAAWCSNLTAVWTATWGHSGGADIIELLAHSDGSVVAFSHVQSWSPAAGTVSGESLTIDFGAHSGEKLEGTGTLAVAASGARLGNWVINWGDGSVWYRAGEPTHCARPLPPASPMPPALPPADTVLTCVDDCRPFIPYYGGGFDFTSDGECDDGGDSSHFSYCTLGRDCSDCGVRTVPACSNTCAASAPTPTCDDGGPQSNGSSCAFGSDCFDCGDRSGLGYVAPPSEPPAGPSLPALFSLCTDTCIIAQWGVDYSSDGDCDDGGPGSEYSVCALGTDCTDCGARSVLTGCENSCTYANDGTCDDGGGGSPQFCELGTDCFDCGDRTNYSAVTPVPLALGGGDSNVAVVAGVAVGAGAVTLAALAVALLLYRRKRDGASTVVVRPRLTPHDVQTATSATRAVPVGEASVATPAGATDPLQVAAEGSRRSSRRPSSDIPRGMPVVEATSVQLVEASGARVSVSEETSQV